MKKFNLITLISILSFSATAFATYQTIQFPSLDVMKMHQLELENERKGEAPRFAVPREISIDALSSSDWTKEGNDLIWTLRIKATNAISLNLAFEEFKLSDGAQLLISSFDQKEHIRAFTSRDNNVDQELWTPVIMAEDILVKLVIPQDEFSQNKLVLTKVNQGFRTFGQSTEKSGSCNIDVTCSQAKGWENEINTVGVISTGGSTFCTGFMVNNTDNDRTPYFMTANHCRVRASNAASLVVYWNYQNSTCGGNDARKNTFQTGSQFLAASSKSDFTLVRLNQEPDVAWNVQYAGWDRSGVDATKLTGIHHPSTDQKAISHGFDPSTLTTYLGSQVLSSKDATHVRVQKWDEGTTEPGSSGSPLFDQNHRVIGQLHGGYASCSSQTSDWYGRIAVSWEGDGSASTRLKDWLDASGTGALTTDTL